MTHVSPAGFSADGVAVPQSTSARQRGQKLSPSAVGRLLAIVAVMAFGAAPVIGTETSLLIVVAIAAGVTATYVSTPAIGLVGLGVLCTLDAPIRVWVVPRFGLPYNTMHFVVLALGALSLPTLLRLRTAQSKWLAIMMVVFGLQVLPSTDRLAGVQIVMEVVSALVLTSLCLRSVLRQQVLYGWAVANSSVAIMCLLAYILAPPSQAINVNALAQAPIAGLASIALAACQPGVVRRWALLGALTVANVCLVFVLGTRGGFVVAMLPVALILSRAPKLQWKGYIIGLFVIAFLIASVRFLGEFSSAMGRWGRLTDPTLTLDKATSQRSELAVIGWRRFVDNPMGIGTGSFSSYDPSLLIAGMPVAAHSAWVKTLAENGVPGFLVLLGYLLSFLRSGSRAGGVGRSLGLCTTLVLATAFLFSEFQSKSLWLMAAGTTALLGGTAGLGAGMRRTNGNSQAIMRRP